MYHLLSFVSRGKIRKKVLNNLSVPDTPTELAKKIGTHRSTTSRTILALQKKGLVQCMTPKQKMGRYYKISETGKKVLKALNERK